jgi:hypothetical protein
MKRLFLGAAIAVLFVSCSPMPYDAALSDAARTVVKLTQDNSVTMSSDNSTMPEDMTFFPRVTSSGFDYTTGFVSGLEGASVQARSVVLDAGSQELKITSYYSSMIPNLDARYPAWTAWPAKDTALINAYLFLLTFDPLYPLSDNRFSLLQASLSSPVADNDLHNQVSSNLGYDVEVIGGSVQAAVSTTSDTTFWLARDITYSDYAELSSPVSSTPVTVSPIRTVSYHYALNFLPSDLTRVQYFHDMNEAGDADRLPLASFASWYDTTAGKWVCYRWAEFPVSTGLYPYVRLPIDHRIDALLSTGQLLSAEDGTGRLYGRDGTLLATFPMGSLRFMAEEYVGGVARTYFTQRLVYDNTVHFVTYWIRTAELSTLGN